MNATTLSISLPNKGCDRGCPYCISRMTPEVETNEDLFRRNYYKAYEYAVRSGVTDVVITGKGEPLLSEDNGKWITFALMGTFRIPYVLQTNGIRFFGTPSDYEWLFKKIDIVAFSVEEWNAAHKLNDYWELLKSWDCTIRLVFNMTYDVINTDPHDILFQCKKEGIDQVTFRRLTIPSWNKLMESEPLKAEAWIQENIPFEMEKTFSAMVDQELRRRGTAIRTLPYGPTLYDWNGLAVVMFPYCLQDGAPEDRIRSLIYQEDGHLYTHWQSLASRIF